MRPCCFQPPAPSPHPCNSVLVSQEKSHSGHLSSAGEVIGNRNVLNQHLKTRLFLVLSDSSVKAATAHSEEMNAARGPVKSCLIQWIDILVLREVTPGASGEQLQAAVCNGRFRISREGGRRGQRRGGVSLLMLKEKLIPVSWR